MLSRSSPVVGWAEATGDDVLSDVVADLGAGCPAHPVRATSTIAAAATLRAYFTSVLPGVERGNHGLGVLPGLLHRGSR
jgi:hypothetical protein